MTGFDFLTGRQTAYRIPLKPVWSWREFLAALRKVESYPTNPGKGKPPYFTAGITPNLWSLIQTANTPVWLGLGLEADYHTYNVLTEKLTPCRPKYDKDGNRINVKPPCEPYSFGPYQIWEDYFDDALERPQYWPNDPYCMDLLETTVQGGGWFQGAGDLPVRSVFPVVQWDKELSECIIEAYMRRFTSLKRPQDPGLVDRGHAGQLTIQDIERLCRIHNGGPSAPVNQDTTDHFNKVKNFLPPR